MPEVKLLYFGPLRTALDLPNDHAPVVVELPSSKTTLVELRQHLIDQHADNAEFRQWLLKSTWSVDEAMVDEDYELRGGELVVAIPPVSGG